MMEIIQCWMICDLVNFDNDKNTKKKKQKTTIQKRKVKKKKNNNTKKEKQQYKKERQICKKGKTKNVNNDHFNFINFITI